VRVCTQARVRLTKKQDQEAKNDRQTELHVIKENTPENNHFMFKQDKTLQSIYK
jgi:hypothetical protein